MAEQRICPRFEKAIGVLGKRWTGSVVQALIEGPRRFSEIANYVTGLSDRVLSERLQELEREGIVERRVYDQRPVLVEYGLTEKGRELKQVCDAIHSWADRWEEVPTPTSTV